MRHCNLPRTNFQNRFLGAQKNQAKTSSTFQVEIFTGDGGLKAYEPATPAPTRRSSQTKR